MIHIWKDNLGKLIARIEGKEYQIALVRYLPLTPGENSFGIFEIDVWGKRTREIVSVFDFEELTEEARKIVIEDSLKKISLIEIRKIHSVTSRGNKFRFNVSTIDGDTIFETAENESHLFKKHHTAYMKDDKGLIFYINLDRLDAQSRTILDEYM